MDIKQIEKFYKMVCGEVYSEPDSQMHTKLIDQIIPSIYNRPDGPKKGEKIVDIGCGPGLAMDKLVELGVDKKDIVGATLGTDDLRRTREKGYECHEYDMTFTKFANESFDYAIVRHCLEHSVWPYLTLMEFNRIMKMHGRMYIEMPAPGTDRKLEHWPNHYSIMNQTQWGSLMLRAGFEYQSNTFPVTVDQGKGEDAKTFNEPYHWYIITKIADRSDYSPATADKMMELTKLVQDWTQKNGVN